MQATFALLRTVSAQRGNAKNQTAFDLCRRVPCNVMRCAGVCRVM